MSGHPPFPSGPPVGAPPPGWEPPVTTSPPPVGILSPTPALGAHPTAPEPTGRRGWTGVEVLVIALAGVMLGLLVGVIVGTRLDDRRNDEVGLDTGSNGEPIAIRTATNIGAGWTVRVTESNPDGWELMKDLREQNEPPGANESYLLVSLEMQFSPTAGTSDTADPNTVLLSIVDDRGEEYLTFQHSCGYFPNPVFQYGPMVPGETIEANQCWAVPADRVEGMVLVVAALTGDPPQAFALR